MKKYIIYLGVLLVIVTLSVGFSAFQRQLLIDNNPFTVRLQEDTRVSNVSVKSVSNQVISNFEDYNKSKIFGNVTFPSASSYILYNSSSSQQPGNCSFKSLNLSFLRNSLSSSNLFIRSIFIL